MAGLELIKASELEQDKPSSQWTRHGAANAGQLKKRFSVPHGPDLSKDHKYANQAASWGLEVQFEPIDWMRSSLLYEKALWTLVKNVFYLCAIEL